MNEKEQQIFDAIPRPPVDAPFKLVKVETVWQPHPYCIDTKHVVYASDHHGGMLGAEAIRGAEKNGAHCGMRSKHAGYCQLPYDEHRSDLTLFIEVENNRDLNAIPGLHAYLVSVKDEATRLGIGGFAFPARRPS